MAGGIWKLSGGKSMSESVKWWADCSFIRRLMPEYDKISLSELRLRLADLAAAGYGAIEITAPYASSGFYPWWGLRPYDYFQINPHLRGSLQELDEFIADCHLHGLRVLFFINLGYGDVQSPLWKKACQDKRRGMDTPESRYFLWKDSLKDDLKDDLKDPLKASSKDPLKAPSKDLLKAPSEDPLKAPLKASFGSEPVSENSSFFQEGRWTWSQEAESWYWCFWEGAGLSEPQYNWQEPAFQAYVSQIVRFWMEREPDGLIIDAVNKYTNCHWNVMKSCITDIVHQRQGAICIPEGAGGFGDDALDFVSKGGFDVVEDQSFESDLSWNGSVVMDVIMGKPAWEIEKRLACHDRSLEKGAGLWSYPGFGSGWTPARRLLSLAVLMGTGHMTEILSEYLIDFSREEKQQLKNLLSIGKHPALTQTARRMVLENSDPEHFYTIAKRQNGMSLLCLYNFTENPADITVKVSAPSTGNGEIYRDLITEEIKETNPATGQLILHMSPLGWRFLEKY